MNFNEQSVFENIYSLLAKWVNANDYLWSQDDMFSQIRSQKIGIRYFPTVIHAQINTFLHFYWWFSRKGFSNETRTQQQSSIKLSCILIECWRGGWGTKSMTLVWKLGEPTSPNHKEPFTYIRGCWRFLWIKKCPYYHRRSKYLHGLVTSISLHRVRREKNIYMRCINVESKMKTKI